MQIITIIGVVIFTFLAYLYFAARKMKNTPMVADSTKIKVLTDKNFNHQIKSGVILVDFWASWCAPCKMMAPVLNEVSEELNGNYYIGKLNVEQYQAISVKYNVRNIPTMILYKNGKEINRFVGIKSKDFLLKEMAKVG
jgi:thioredoxin 1